MSNIYAPVEDFVFTTDGGAIPAYADVVFIGGASATDLTLPNPDTSYNGYTMTLVAITAQAHTVTNTTGFNGGSTSSDVATFGGAIGDGFSIVAYNGVWYTTRLTNVTLG